MKKHANVLLIFAVFVLTFISAAFSVKASADMGPKPSVTVNVTNMPEGGVYYMTLLSEHEISGPYRADAKRHGEINEIDKKFADYKDEDGYYYLYYYERVSAEESFKWGYYPPQRFKILIYSANQDVFISSGKLEQYAFASYFTASVSGDKLLAEDELKVVRSYDYFGEICKLILRIVFTVAVEIGIAFLFGYRGKSFKVILIANLVTQIALNVGLNVINYLNGLLFLIIAYIFFEIVILLAESVFYMIAVPKIDKDCPKKLKRFWVLLLYSVAANVASFALGALIFWSIGI